MADQRAGIPTHALVSAVVDAECGTTGIAVILRDHARDTVYSTSYSKCDISLQAAAYAAISEALSSARETGSHAMTVYCDVGSVVFQLNKEEEVPEELLSHNLQLRALFNTFRYVRVKLAQSGNYFIAHKLAAGAAKSCAADIPAQPMLPLPLTAR